MRSLSASVAALVFALVPCASAPAAVRVLEGERLAGAGAVMRDAKASRGRALELRPRADATAQVRTGRLGAVLVRARHTGCAGSPQLTVRLGGAPAAQVAIGRAYRERKVRGIFEAGSHALRVGFTGGTGRGCRARLDRLRFRPTRRAAPVTPGAPAPGAGPGSAAPAARRAIPLGTSIVLGHLRADPAYRQALLAEFTQYSPENELKMNRVQPERGRFAFADADALVDFASAHGRTVRGHTLIYGKETPPWVGRLLLAEDVERELRAHVRGVMGRYRGRIREWDVVNEAVDTDGSFRPNAFYDKLGERYVEIAFDEARRTDPAARLFYNDYNGETDNFKRAAIASLVGKLRAKGLIDGVGLQMHTGIVGYPTGRELEDTMRLFARLGVEVQVTEMDVSAKGDGTQGSLASRLELQASVFAGAANACQAVAACTRFTVWGVNDKYSWIGADQIPLLLDSAFAPKPALRAVRAALSP